MQRGVLSLSEIELTQLLKIFDIEVFNGTPLYEKLKSASQSNNQEIKILLSEDEIEKIMDEVGPPTYQSEIANQAIEKINQLLITLRTNPTI